MLSEKEQQSIYPMALDAESGAAAAHDAEEIRNKKRKKRIMYIVLSVVFKAALTVVLSFTVMKVRGPKFRVRTAVITHISAGTPETPSFSATVNAELAVKNPNFGRYDYKEATVEFMHGGASVGQATVNSSRANMKSTKKLQVAVDLNLTGSSQLASDLSDGVLRLSSRSKMVGKVEKFLVMKMKRTATMNCTMEIVIATQLITNITCH